MIKVRQEIIEAIKRATSVENINLEIPALEQFGDYSSNVALATFSKSEKLNSKLQAKSKSEIKNPKQYAEYIVGELEKDDKLDQIVSKIEVKGTGFINFWVEKEVLRENLEEIVERGEDYGKIETGPASAQGYGEARKKVNFEFGQPNTHKLPHVGHLYSYILGNSLTRILEANGHEVRRSNYQGDVGMHVAKCLWAYLEEKPEVPESLEGKVEVLQKMYQIGSRAYEEQDYAKREINKLNNGIYYMEPKLGELWQETRRWSVEYYKDFEKRLGIKFDRYYFESEIYKDAIKIVKTNSKVFKKSKGAIIFEGSKYGLHDRVFITSEGNPTYEAKDMALGYLKQKEWPADKIMITTASEQNEYFKVIFKALEKLDDRFKGKLKHIGF